MATFTPIQVAIRGTTVLLRSAAEDDAPAIIANQEELALEGAGTIYAPSEVDRDEPAQRRRICRVLDAPDDILIVADADGRVVGEASFHAGNARRIAHRGMLGVSVVPGWRRRGLGRALVSTVVEWCRARPGIEKISLWVFSNNEPAIALYRSLGFAEEGRRVREIRFGAGRYTDDLVMALFVRDPEP